MRPRLVRDEYDDQGDYNPTSALSGREMETPVEMAERQVREARKVRDKIEAGGGLDFPWGDLSGVVGSLLPGWLVAVGGRAKAGKTLFLRECFTAWIEAGKTLVYVGTETEAASLRLAWAAVRCGLPITEGHQPSSSANKARMDADLAEQATNLAKRAIFASMQDGTVEELAYWVQYARVAKAHGLLFDHVHRMEVGKGERWQGMGDAVRAIKNMARDGQLLVVAGAQLKTADGDVLSENIVPGSGSWAETSNLQRECDVAIQLWKPLKPGVSAQQMREARLDVSKKAELVQQGIMGIRVAAHRWRGEMMDKYVRLVVANDQIASWTARTEERPIYGD